MRKGYMFAAGIAAVSLIALVGWAYQDPGDRRQIHLLGSGYRIGTNNNKLYAFTLPSHQH